MRFAMAPSTLGRLGAAAVAFVAGCCTTQAWDLSGAPALPPDDQYRTGTEHGADLYVWACYRGEHVVIAKYSSFLISARPHLERTACGVMTPTEAALAREPHEVTPFPWPGTAASTPSAVPSAAPSGVGSVP